MLGFWWLVVEEEVEGEMAVNYMRDVLLVNSRGRMMMGKGVKEYSQLD